ncbi:MAG TPA: SDR family NAD(P)-dependent oxidoreductase [Vulgatibacteraceae bacterium]|nr:SDR family NAD(P)-dependent oxidoreductase [Vulgatibacteraceae bacterium]
MGSYAGRVGLVTGGGRGLGRAHALALAGRGMAVVVNDTGAAGDGTGPDPAVAQRVVDEINAAGGHAFASAHDVSTHEGAAAAVRVALDECGRLDAVVNNAGILRDRTFAKMTLDDFDAVVGVHLGGSAYVTHAAWPALCESGSGRVVFTSSASGLYGQFGQANYGAAKAAMLGLVNVLKLEGRRKGVLVNGIAPVAHTRMTDPLLPEEAKPKLGPEQVSPLVAWLASEECDQTGLMLEVAAGLVARVQVTETETVPLAGADGKATDVGAVVRRLTEMPPGDPYPSSDEATSRYVSAAAGG